jgi:hypothetical protein
MGNLGRPGVRSGENGVQDGRLCTMILSLRDASALYP